MHCIVVRIGLKSPVCFSAVTNIDPHAARAALFRPARKWMFQQDDVHGKASRVQDTNYKN